MVIAIIGILVALLLPAVQAAREAARRTQCGNNLKQLGLALHNYHTSVGTFPPGSLTLVRATGSDGTDDENWTNWAVAILPYLEQQPLYDQYRQDLPNRHAENADVLGTPLPVMTCPSDAPIDAISAMLHGPLDLAPAAPGSYRAMTGVLFQDNTGKWFTWTVYPATEGTPPLDNNRRFRGALHVVGLSTLTCESVATIRDGTSNSLMVGEYHAASGNVNDFRALWASSWRMHSQGEALADSLLRQGDLNRCLDTITGGYTWRCYRQFASQHDGGAQFLFCDGSVRFLGQHLDGRLYEDLATIAGGEIVSDF